MDDPPAPVRKPATLSSEGAGSSFSMKFADQREHLIDRLASIAILFE